MLGIMKLVENGTCQWCNKSKEVVELHIESGQTIKLCWQDLKKTVKLRLLTTREEKKV